MALTVGDRADREIIYRLIGTNPAASNTSVQGDSLTLRLFKDARVLSKGDSKFLFHSATGAGYAYIVLNPTAWTISTLNPGTGDTNMASYAQQTFTFTGADSVSGYMVWTVKNRGATGDSILMWAEKFSDGPYIIPAGGGTIKVTPRIIVS